MTTREAGRAAYDAYCAARQAFVPNIGISPWEAMDYDSRRAWAAAEGAGARVPAEPPTGEALERHREHAVELLRIRQCSDTAYEEAIADVAAALASAQQEAFAAGRASGGEWVAASERLPKEGAVVLAFAAGWTRPVTCQFNGPDEGWCDVEVSRTVMVTITHWMPLPPPPVKPTEGGGR